VSAANKRKGSMFETDIEQFVNGCGLKARRLPRAGVKDIGDIAIEVGNDVTLVVEAKNVKVPDMAGFLREAEVEARHYDEKYNVSTVGCVITKTRQKGTGEARVTLTLESFIDLLLWTKRA